MPLVRMKAAPVKTDGERLGNEFMNGVFFSAQVGLSPNRHKPFFAQSLHLDAGWSYQAAAKFCTRHMIGRFLRHSKAVLIPGFITKNEIKFTISKGPKMNSQ